MNFRNHCIIAILLILCLIVSISFAEDMCGPNLHWSLSDSGTLTISGTGEMQVGYSSPWKDSKKAIIKIVVDEGVTSISDNAFNGCENAIEVSLPQSLLDIGESAFEKCSNLVKINIPNSITIIKEKTFNACKSLVDISLPGGLISIEASAFCDCKGLEKMHIPANVASISVDRVFQECENLQ